MKKTISIFLLLYCAFTGLAQSNIIVNRDYIYFGNDVNKAGLRVVGLNKTLKSTFQGGKIECENLTLYGCIDSMGNEVIPIEYDGVSLSRDKDYIIVKSRAKNGYSPMKSPDSLYFYHKYDFRNEVGQNYYYGLYSEDGKKLIIPVVYKEIMAPPSFKKSECAIVSIKNVISKDDYGWADKYVVKYGIFNTSGDLLFRLIYDDIKWLDQDRGYLQVRLNDKWGFYDNHGKQLYPTQLNDDDWEYKDDFAIIRHQLERGVYNLKTCNFSIPTGTYNTLTHFNGKTLWADNHYLINTDGTVVNDITGRISKFIESGYNSPVLSIMNDVHYIYSESVKQNRATIYYYYDDLGREYTDYNIAKAANDSIRNAFDDTLATIVWHSNSESVQNNNYHLVVSVQSRSDVRDVYLVVNEITLRDIKINRINDHEMSISKDLTLNEGSNKIKVCVINAAGTAQEEKKIVYRAQSTDIDEPSIKWLDFATSDDNNELKLKLGIKSSSKIEDVTITLNNDAPKSVVSEIQTLTRGIRTVDDDGYDMIIEQSLELKRGLNKVAVNVRNSAGCITISERKVRFQETIIHDEMGKRIALVIGNSEYSRPDMRLTNPVNDAQEMAKKLESLGFEIILKQNATLQQIEEGLDEFSERASGYDVALFYFAGHGIQSKGNNYLLPVNIDNLKEETLPWDCLDAGKVLAAMDAAKCTLKIVVLDACRNNPLTTQWYRGVGNRGLSNMPSTDGTIIAYSTSAGHTASDGDGQNSPYTEAFLEALDETDLNIMDFFQKVGSLVKKKTDMKQTPWISSSYYDNFYFNKTT